MVKIGTHSGKFHCDEALGCFLLRQTEAYSDADIVRTRDEAVLKDLDVVIDVGGKYDPGVLVVIIADHIVLIVVKLVRRLVVQDGGVYHSFECARCAEAKRFDHHQRGFTEVFGHGVLPSLEL
jgi:uncharacterized UPF0160 family protein